ncbi:MAG: DEAD/DEAH box helicase family protein [Candidatus Aenigmatarchaeota archaeon]
MRIVKIEEEGVGKENKSIEKYFAYQKWRKYQKEIAEIIYESLKNNKEHVVLEAPTGLGKTSAVLSATLPIIIDDELKLLWCCRTHQQVIGVLNEVMKIKEENIKPIGLWGRKQMCLNVEVNNLSENVFRHACGMLRRSFRCPFFRNEEQWIIEATKDVIYPNEAKKKFESYQFCP